MKESLNLSQTLYDWSSPTVLISDLHLNGGTRDHLVLKHLRTLFSNEQHEELSSSTTIKRLVLLGDVFDFQLGYKNTIYRAHLPFYFFLQELINKGIEIFVFTGNHDPDLHPVLTEDLNVPVLTQPTLINIFDSMVRLEHGDLLEYSPVKRLLCRFVRHPLTCRMARFFPPHIMWLITSRWGTQEGNLESYDQQHLLKMIEHRWPKYAMEGIDYWVFGHFHQALAWDAPNQEVRKDCPSQVFVLGDQVRLHTYLLWNENGPQLHQFSD